VGVLVMPQPYDFALSTERYRAFGPDLANLWYEGGLHRVVDGQAVRIEAALDGVDVEPLDEWIAAEVRVLLGLAFDLAAFHAWAATVDGPLPEIAERLAGFRPTLQPDPWEAIVTSITAQQVSLQSAFAIRSRLVARFGERVGRVHAFPTRERLAAASEEEVVACGFSRRKAEYVVGLARSELDLERLAARADDDVREALVVQRGLGEWSADWFLARHLGRPHAWPAGDLGLRKAVSIFYGDGRELTTQEVRRMGERFAPFENLTAQFLLLGLRVQ
jgi:DNA-3-methyladenine glycosylase II